MSISSLSLTKFTFCSESRSHPSSTEMLLLEELQFEKSAAEEIRIKNGRRYFLVNSLFIIVFPIVFQKLFLIYLLVSGAGGTIRKKIFLKICRRGCMSGHHPCIGQKRF